MASSSVQKNIGFDRRFYGNDAIWGKCSAFCTMKAVSECVV